MPNDFRKACREEQDPKAGFNRYPAEGREGAVKIHEFQAKRLLKGYGIPMPRGVVAFNASEAEAAARFLGGRQWVVKAQIHAGGRGRAGGVKLIDKAEAVESAAAALLGKALVTAQTGSKGLTVKRLYVEEALKPARELYLAVYVDRAAARITFLGSPDGGMRIEDHAARGTAKVEKLALDGRVGLPADDARAFAKRIGAGLNADIAVARIMSAMYTAFLALDASLIEINPLAILEDGSVAALDARVTLDDNALFRHPDLEALRDEDEVSATELEAARHEINFVALDGTVGCVVNGAGLGMATLDLLKLRGIEPANFMDIRPVATREQIAHGFRMVLANAQNKCLLVNIFGGGIIRCDLIAEGLTLAARQSALPMPIVVRFAGTNAEHGRKLLANAGLKVEFATSLGDAADRVLHLVRLGGGNGQTRAATSRT